MQAIGNQTFVSTINNHFLRLYGVCRFCWSDIWHARNLLHHIHVLNVWCNRSAIRIHWKGWINIPDPVSQSNWIMFHIHCIWCAISDNSIVRHWRQFTIIYRILQCFAVLYFTIYIVRASWFSSRSIVATWPQWNWQSRTPPCICIESEKNESTATNHGKQHYKCC